MDQKVLDRLAYYGFTSNRISKGEKVIINDLIIAYVNESSKKAAKHLFNSLAFFASRHYCTFNADLLVKNREMIHGKPKRKIKKVIDIQPIDPARIPAKKDHTTDHRSRKIASNYQERKKNLPIPKNQANDLDYHYCLHCGERATNQKELDRFFGKEKINGVMCYDIVCKGCKDDH